MSETIDPPKDERSGSTDCSQSLDPVRIEEALDGIHGPRETYRPLLDPTNILKRICRNAEGHALRNNTEPWVYVSDVTGHGSGVSNAIYYLYSESD